MSDASIFIVGSVVFIATAWATFAVGLSWFGGLQEQDLRVDAPLEEKSDRRTDRPGLQQQP